MLMLQLYIGESHYALDSSHVVEVVPQVVVQAMTRTPDYILGRMNYRGIPTPVIDLSRLLTGLSSEECLHTRIVVCTYDDGKHIGLLAERVTATLQAKEEDFQAVGLQSDSVSYLGGILNDAEGGVQYLHFDDLLTHVRNELHGEEA